jgi:hypothetical protein
MASSTDVICAAIRLRRLLAFEYQGLPRLVAPYCHGISRRGEEVLRGVQVGGSSRSGLLGAGKLWRVAQMRQLRDGGESFVPNDPHYNPDDSALVEIHCRV